MEKLNAARAKPQDFDRLSVKNMHPDQESKDRVDAAYSVAERDDPRENEFAPEVAKGEYVDLHQARQRATYANRPRHRSRPLKEAFCVVGIRNPCNVMPKWGTAIGKSKSAHMAIVPTESAANAILANHNKLLEQAAVATVIPFQVMPN
jgi:hypothetical protein